MFTLDQINEIHDRCGKQATLFQYLDALKAVGVDKSESFLTDGHSEYYGANGQKVVSPPVHEEYAIAKVSDKSSLLKHLSLHSQHKTTYFEMSKGLAESGIEKWAFDTSNKTITYYSLDNCEVLVEEILKMHL